MDDNQKILYFEEKERRQYEHSKDVQKTIRWAILSVLSISMMVLACLTISLCFYMYYVVPVEEESSVADNGSQIVIHSVLEGDNTNGM